MPPIPPITRNLMIICVVAFLLDGLVGLQAWFALWPLTSGYFMPWQVLSYGLLHGDTSHLFFNMLGLWMFGAELENLWGRNRYLQFIGVTLLSAAAAQLLVTFLMGTRGPTVGASGALYGLLLAYGMAFPRRQFDLVGFLPMLLLVAPSQSLNIVGVVLYVMLMTNRQAVPIPPVYVKALVMVAIFGVLEFVLGMFFRHGGIAHFAHLGGMLGGWLMMRYWRYARRGGGHWRR
jgi:membrane associated rhomboid family serine protease